MTYNDPGLMFEFRQGTESSCSEMALAKTFKCAGLMKCFVSLDVKAFGNDKKN